VVAEQVDHQEVVHQVALTEKVKQHIQVAEAVTLDPTHTQDQAEVAVEPLSY
tara:strand:- start:175 stop:330 length:156 start_codon:yes stop_codon:yes gene_type:complete